jgi:broad specificity phosphatase PhoE
MSHIILIRHGQTAHNREQIFRGRLDVPLDEHGRRQVRLLAQALTGRGLGAVCASPLRRARETARQLSPCSGIPVRESPELMDVDFGEWQGLPLAEVERRWPDLLGRYHSDPGDFRAPGGESLEEVRARASAFVSDMTAAACDRPVALVTHRVVIKAILCDVLGAGLRPFWRLRQDTAAVSELAEYGGGLAIAVLNQRCHLQSLGEGGQADF